MDVYSLLLEMQRSPRDHLPVGFPLSKGRQDPAGLLGKCLGGNILFRTTDQRVKDNMQSNNF